MRRQGVVDTAGGLLPFGHLGWAYRDRTEFHARAAEYCRDGLAQNQWVEFVGAGTRSGLWEELTFVLGTGPDAEGVGVTPVDEFYAFHPGDELLVDAPAAVAKRVAAVEEVVAAGYAGYRAIVDATAVARTPKQREAFAEFEYLIDQKMAVLPVSALCAYDSARLGPAAAELICLHPYVSPTATDFRLYAEPDAAFALAGDLDFTSAELFPRTARRVWPAAGDTAVIDAHALTFVSHRQLLTLEHCARAHGQAVVLRGAPALVTRVVDVLGLDNVRVEARP